MKPEHRRVVTLDGAGQFGVREERIPELKPGSVLVAVKSSLVSPGTELGGVPEKRRNPKPGAEARPFGYGNAGIVLKVGKDCPGLEPGQRVACMGAGYAYHATHAVIPRNLAVPVPEGLSFDEAAFAHLAATALWAVRRADIEFGQHVAVMGLGIVGQIAVQIARWSGAHVMGVDRLPLRLEIAGRCGADRVFNPAQGDLAKAAAEFSRGYGMDAVIMAFGGEATAAMESACSIMKTAPDGHRYGCIVIVGGAKFTAEFPTAFGNIDVRASSRPGPGYHDEAWEFGRDYPPVFVPWTTRRNLEECLEFAAAGRLNFPALITHRMPLDNAPEGCEELIRNPDRTLGVIFNP
jgi:threonine dehydrogenase-like Zn-dependent dehydrogenase